MNFIRCFRFRPTRPIVIVLVALMLAAQAASTRGGPIFDAATGRLSFQAHLTDNNGTPLPGPTANLTFTVYNAANGVVEGPIAMANVPMTGGMVDVFVPVSRTSFDGTQRRLGISVNGGPEMSPRIDLAAVPFAFRVDRVENAELTDNVVLGDAATAGSLTIYRNSANAPSITLNGATSQISTFGDGDREMTRLWGTSSGELQIFGQNGNLTAYISGGSNAFMALRDSAATPRITLDAQTSTVRVQTGFDLYDFATEVTPGTFRRFSWGGQLDIYDETGSHTLRAGSSSSVGGYIELYRGTGGTSLFLDGDDGSGGGILDVRNAAQTTTILATGTSGHLELRNSGSAATVLLDADEIGDGVIRLIDGSGNQAIQLHSDSVGTAGEVAMYGPNGVTKTVQVVAAETSTTGAQMVLRKANGTATVEIDAENGTAGGIINMFNSAGTQTVEVDADESDDSVVRLRDAAGNAAVHLYSDSVGSAGEIAMYGPNGTTKTVQIVAAENSTTGSQIVLRRADGTATIELDAEFGAAGADGRIKTQVLEITGGSDLSEQFRIHGGDQSPVPGMVVSISPIDTGSLVVSERPYDRTVAGIISGAGGVRVGMRMGQPGTAADGDHPVALTGRVYCWCDASSGPIEPGDLLTTSATPGHAMRVTDHARASGAVLGKAMGSLKEGRGLVLVLVNLQ